MEDVRKLFHGNMHVYKLIQLKYQICHNAQHAEKATQPGRICYIRFYINTTSIHFKKHLHIENFGDASCIGVQTHFEHKVNIMKPAQPSLPNSVPNTKP